MSEMNISLKRFQNRLGYQFKDVSQLQLALTHRSCGSQNNERLEFLGDAVLGAIVAELLYRKFPDAREGDLSRLRSMLVKGKALAVLAKELELGEQLLLGGGERKSGGHRRETILADALEAVIGAIYLESGLEVTRECVHRWMDQRIANLTLKSQDKDAKTRLQEFLQSRGKALPVYAIEKTEGEPHAQIFTVSCRVELLPEAMTASGHSRREAEQQVAENILEALAVN